MGHNQQEQQQRLPTPMPAPSSTAAHLRLKKKKGKFLKETADMADDGERCSRLRTTCLLFVIMLSGVDGIRTGDNIATTRNLLELMSDQGLTWFLSLIRKAEIESTFRGTDEMTVFAFNNTAFEILPMERKTVIRNKDRQETEDFVKFHTVYKNRILTQDILDNQELRSNGPNQNILFTNKKRVQIGINYDHTEQLFINGARIVKRDIYASNGILHIIDRVLELTSNKMAVPYLDNPDDPRVKGKQFYDLIQLSNVRDELKNEGRMTLFVPTDEAMSKIDKEKLDQQKQNPQLLREIILKHKVSSQVIFTSTVEFGTQWSPNRNIPILHKNNFEQVSISSGGTTALIVLGNITVGNGVIHMIDNLLGFTYKNVMEQIMEDPELSEFYNLLTKVHVQQIEEAVGTKDKVTIFAPTNRAFEHIKAYRNKLKSDPKFIEEVIKYHIVEDSSWQIAPITVEYYAKERRRCMRGSYLSVYNFRYDRYVHGGYVTAKIVRADVGCTNGVVQYIDQILGVPNEDIMSVIHNHPWLKNLPFKAYSLTGLEDSLSGEHVGNKENSFNLCPEKTCFYTVFVPNETAFQQMRINSQAEHLLQDANIYRQLLERLIIKNKRIYDEELSQGRFNVGAVNGNRILIEKYGNRLYLRYRGRVTTILQSDLGATNGVVHIVDQLLWTTDDAYMSAGHSYQARFWDSILVLIILISIDILLH